MNISDLEEVFWSIAREQPVRVRLARVVRALRDEMVHCHVSGQEHGYENEIAASRAAEEFVDRLLTKILGSDATAEGGTG